MYAMKKNIEKNPLYPMIKANMPSKGQGMVKNRAISDTDSASDVSLSDEISHEELLTRVGQNKDREAFIQLFTYFGPRVKSYLLKQGASEDQAEEVMQDAMILMWRRASTYDPKKAKASTWIFTVARNRRIDILRKNSRSEFLSDATVIEQTQTDENEPSAEDIYAQRQESDSLREHIETLPKEQMELVEMAYFQDKSHQEIADETDIPLGTVKSRIRLALGKLRKKIEDTK